MLDSLDHGIIIVLLEQEGYDSHLASYVRMFKEDLLRPRLHRCAAYLSSDITPHSKPVFYFFALVARYRLIILLSPTNKFEDDRCHGCRTRHPSSQDICEDIPLANSFVIGTAVINTHTPCSFRLCQ